ncbi:MtrB/PioB family outer membrane beta-barrel protein [Desulfuromonas sp. AOP6]|uniref:MtrB/PioB family outer membrane beta-barrel protein n=1 Tax=Desulfuromonas sp. AOP6 TaxID=1566351 RepID=UPI00126E306A|nr:MtrB/PioB family outer membrane beta-barrel protein [Desulfuromonas sp. AOP6]BCA79731.1 hypothetical protein AOP6_1518 [Desulfuromonas sp. AOP6]
MNKTRIHFLLQIVALVAAGTLSPVFSEMDCQDPDPRILESAFSLGYRVVDSQKNTQRAGEYSFLESGTVAGIVLKDLKATQRFRFEADYFDQTDYNAEVDFDYRGLFRLHATSATFNHQLEHFPGIDDALLPLQVEPLVKFTDHNPGEVYAIEVKRDEVSLRARLPEFPAHFNLAYWRLQRQGTRQGCFVDEGSAQSADCNSCHLQSKTERVNQITEEIRGGLDAHLGRVDVSYSGFYRELRNKSRALSDPFGELIDTHTDPDTLYRHAGEYEHDAVPESRHIAHSLSLHTSLSGGLTAGGMVSVGEMESGSKVSDVDFVKSKSDYWKAAGDFTLTPSSKWTLTLRYRMLDMDTQNSDFITVSGLPDASIPVRDSMDVKRAHYGSRLSYRPNYRLTIQGDLEREEVERTTTGPMLDEYNDPFWHLPEKENKSSYKVSLIARPLGTPKFRLNLSYKFLTSDDPSYGTSLKNGHHGFAGTTLTLTDRAGMTANVLVIREENNRIERTLFHDSTTLNRYQISRQLASENATAGFWVVPRKGLQVNIRYGYLHSRTEQGLLFGNDHYSDYVILDENAEFEQTVHTAELSSAWHINEQVSLQGEARLTRSASRFDPSFAYQPLDYYGIGTTGVDSSTLRQLSELHIFQTAYKVGVDWKFKDEWKCSARYTFDRYEDLEGAVLDGIVQSYLLSLSRAW